VLDIGTGDGHYVYEMARRQPHQFFIGIDANASALAKISEQIHRKPAKGGAANTLFLQAAVEALPTELTGVASAVQVQFPWGSLLAGVLNGEPGVLQNLRRVCASAATLTIITALDPVCDQRELVRLGLPAPTPAYLRHELLPKYADAGFTPLKIGTLAPVTWPQLTSSWAKRLRGNIERDLICLVLRADG